LADFPNFWRSGLRRWPVVAGLDSGKLL